MATRKFCDRCSCEILDYNLIGNVLQVPIPGQEYDLRKTQSWEKRDTSELCPTCIFELRDFLGLSNTIRIKEIE